MLWVFLYPLSQSIIALFSILTESVADIIEYLIDDFSSEQMLWAFFSENIFDAQI